MYKMIQISKEEYKKCEVEIIDKERYFWVNIKDLEVESNVANWAQIFDSCDLKKKYIYIYIEMNQCLIQDFNNIGCLYEMI